LQRTIATGLFLAALPALVFGPWIEMSAWCGRQPVELGSFIDRTASPPNSIDYDRIWLLNDGYVCSASDAVGDGYPLDSGR
jgi:hypothetical protein